MDNSRPFFRAMFFSLLICSPHLAAGQMPVFTLDGLVKSDVSSASPLLQGRAIPAAADQVAATGPVVITVPCLDLGKIGGGPFQLKYIFAIISYFSHGTRSASLSAVTSAVKAVNKEYYALPDNIDLSDEVAAGSRKTEIYLADDYLDQKLAEIQEYSEGKITVVPFFWSRDPQDTATTIPDFEKRLVEVYTTGATAGRPIYILAHSWGTVIMHETLHRLETSHPEIKIDNFVTIGSPLIPSTMALKVFVQFEAIKEGLSRKITKPANVRIWKNFWASRDFFSNAIPAADENIQVDAKAEPLEPELRRIIWNSPFSQAARNAAGDLMKYLNLNDWHNSYLYDYKAVLLSLKKEVSLPIFKPLVEPRLLSTRK